MLQQALQTNALPFQLCQPPLQLIAALLQLPLRPLQLLELYLILVSDPLNPNGRKGQAARLSLVLQGPSPATFTLQEGPRHRSKGGGRSAPREIQGCFLKQEVNFTPASRSFLH